MIAQCNYVVVNEDLLLYALAVYIGSVFAVQVHDDCHIAGPEQGSVIPTDPFTIDKQVTGLVSSNNHAGLVQRDSIKGLALESKNQLRDRFGRPGRFSF